MSARAIESIARVAQGRIRHGARELLRPFDLELDPGTVHLVVGPAGSGKSLVLRSLSGRRSADLDYDGAWSYRGRVLPNGGSERPPTSIAWVPQLRNGPATALAPDVLDFVWRRIQTAFVQGADLILLDEPTRGLPPNLVEELRDAIESATASGATVVMVTHDLGFARTLRATATVHLMVYGELTVSCPAERFFADPPTDMARELVEKGCCAPPLPEPPELPSTFHWIIPGRLAGTGLPGLLRDADDDLFSMAAAGIEILVSTTERPFDQAALRPYGMRGRHLPIKDMHVPAVAPAVALCRDISRALEDSHPVAVHCKAGLGRTGTILACVLVYDGKSSASAIETLRAINPHYIQTQQQERFVEEFERYVR